MLPVNDTSIVDEIIPIRARFTIRIITMMNEKPFSSISNAGKRNLNSVLSAISAGIYFSSICLILFLPKGSEA